jgi:hypothetical protein
MAIKIKDFRLKCGSRIKEAYIKINSVTIDFDVYDNENRFIIEKAKKTRGLGDNAMSKIGLEAYTILKLMGDIGSYEDVFEPKTICQKIKWYIKDRIYRTKEWIKDRGSRLITWVKEKLSKVF